MAKPLGVVLAGGLGRRIGEPKGGLSLDGATLAGRAAGELWKACGDVVVSIGPDAPHPAPDFPAVRDEPPAGRGPLAGMLAAFEAGGGRDLLVLACDYPGVERPLLDRLLELASEDSDVVLPTDSRGRDHPLVARWSARTAPAIRGALGRGLRRVQGLFPDCCLQRLRPGQLAGIDVDRALLNLNWPRDLERWRAGR